MYPSAGGDQQEEYERCTQFLKDSSPTAAQTLG